MGRTIGIDLGTTNTAVAVMDRGRPRVIEDDKGYKVLPSVVAMNEDGSFVVGQAAKSSVLTRPDLAVFSVKRLIGRRFDSREVEEARRRMPFDVVPAPDGTANVVFGGQEMSPVEVSAIILQVAKQIAEAALGETVDEAVITVPAYFNHGQRAATMEAARLAGLRCDRILNEPTAAALAFGYRKDIEKNIVIYDLGGGTFDVSVLHLSRGVYEVLATSGDTFLGGDDFDGRIMDWLADQFQRQHRIDLRQDQTAYQRLKDAAERAKCELSFSDRTTVLIPRITPKLNLEIQFNRTKLEELVGDLVERTLDVTRDAVEMAGLQLSEVDDVVLVGGQTRMPKLREGISSLFGKEPARSVHPEEVVAIGAAVHGDSRDNPEANPTLLIDVTPFDLGIDSAGGLFTPIVEKNTHIPYTRTRTFTTNVDNQEKVKITVRQGSSRTAADNEFLGEFWLANIRPALRMEPKLDVTFRLDANGMLHVSAVDRATGERQQVVIRNYAEVAGDGRPAGQRAQPQLVGRGNTTRRKEATPNNEAPAVAPSAPAEPPVKKAGFFAGIFGGKSAASKPAPAPAPAAAASPAPAASADAAPAAPEVAAPPPAINLAPPPAINLSPAPVRSSVRPEEDEEVFESPEDDEIIASELDEIEPVEESRPARIGTASSSDLSKFDPYPEPPSRSGSAPSQPASDLADLLAGGEDDLFGMVPESVGDLFTEPPAEPPPPEAPGSGGWEEERPAMMEEDLFGDPDELGALLDDLGGDLYGETPPARPAAAPPKAVQPPPPPPPRPVEPEAPPVRSAPLPSAPPPPQDKKPARLKISYKSRFSFVDEYRENLKKNATFVPAEKPLSEGRRCILEIVVPGVEPILIEGVVSWSSKGRLLMDGEQAGMKVEYQMSFEERRHLESVLKELGG